MKDIILAMKRYKLKKVVCKGSSCPGGSPYRPVNVAFASAE